ncbi:MAG: peptidoglycan DD-metalloendopeptidase family protein [Clostridium sp.]|nr:peptidoglycan DD-metalloendopeptidase family protein [Clostridium sp.]MCM1443934.1 peptidoglycan DD-metalloendopeptidase family protein [Candidatus Amulumruptor caecigallinarius]
MKKIILMILTLIIIVCVSLLSFSYSKSREPGIYYKVYLNGNLLGKISSKSELENYINSEQQQIKNKYSIDEVYVPNGLEIKKELSYIKDTDEITSIYNKINEQSDFTVKGYQITISDDYSNQKIYVLDEQIFKDAVETLINIYVGSDKYQAYLNGTQEEVTEEGSYITDVYIDNDITIKEMNIPSNEKIYTNSKNLNEYLLFGKKVHTIIQGDTIEQILSDYEISKERFLILNPKYNIDYDESIYETQNEAINSLFKVDDEILIDQTYTVKSEDLKTIKDLIKDFEMSEKEFLILNPQYKTIDEELKLGDNISIKKSETIHTVKAGDTIEQVAFDYKISAEEFYISNPQYSSETNMLAVGEEVSINVTNPQLNVTVVQETTKDIEELYRTVEKYDNSMYLGTEKITQQGENGLVRIKQNEKVVNGAIAYVHQTSKETLKQSVDKIVVKGTKQVSTAQPPANINLTNWYWPVDSYHITSPYGWRSGVFHGALDISAPYGSKIYAANDGVVQTLGYIQSGAGRYIVINHDNYTYTQYNHLSAYASGLRVGQTVKKGQVIGYVGMTGYTTGPHLHFAVWRGGTAYRGTATNPWTLYR